MFSQNDRHAISNRCGFDAVVAVTCRTPDLVPTDQAHVKAALHVVNAPHFFSEAETQSARGFLDSRHHSVAGILACLSALPRLSQSNFHDADKTTPFLAMRELLTSHATGENLARAAFENSLKEVRHLRNSPFLHHNFLATLALAAEGLIAHDRGLLSPEHKRLLGNCLCCGDDRIEVTVAHSAARLSMANKSIADSLIDEVASRSGYRSRQAIQEHPFAVALTQAHIPLETIAAFRDLPASNFVTNLANLSFFRSRWRAGD